MRWEEKWLRRIENTSDNYIEIPQVNIGRIISINPLQIMNNKLPLFRENLYINEELLEHTREFKSLTGTIGDKTETISNGSILFESSLKENDLVALREITKNKYLVMFKIV
ncbi:hypothetical protein SR42_15165 [Clostridium botulinum]|uniref:DUF2577 family protein n=1 Tax=Clostridium botulinum TaxID=1491 RepID=UPI000596F702|nr:DUF2577 family protein [Clostridium botulinum]KIL06909.1 hypothetical protein SR42_15165 [Clostridium botulinum]MBY6935296.1 DUF2577 family protein [Clostridium botulinum]NFL82072.1 DUF2577 domain-containing protein [Clostridium botulinum]NFN12661.1 DUF2577 domain-containing protein [Clostridium botulinum]NFO38217.1 DUF2577 domain-containing protein [Clostridium botulinum]